MKELNLKYGCNPNQNPAKIYTSNNENLPIKILNGTPSYINFLDALNGWQLVKELKKATNKPAAASFKHFSPSGAAISSHLTKNLEKALLIHDLNLTSKIAIAYAKARGAERMCSYGDWVALSDECDEQTAQLLKREMSDGIIAPNFSTKALEILKSKKNGFYNIVQINENYQPKLMERREIFGIVLEQQRNNVEINDNTFKNIVSKNKNLTQSALTNLKIATIVLKYTQSNSVCIATNDMAIGVGAGQQSRIDCIKLACKKANRFLLKLHPKILNLPFLTDLKRSTVDNLINDFTENEQPSFLNNENWRKFFTKKPQPLTQLEKQQWLTQNSKNLCLSSDGFFPFDDNVEESNKFNIKFIAQPGGSINDTSIISTCNKFNMLMILTNVRLFFH